MKVTYSDKLKDPRWQRKRLEIFQRDNFTCRLCADATTELQVHHQQYKGANPWDADNEFLITLCCDCHGWVESKKKTPLALYKAHVNWYYDQMIDGQMGFWHFIRMQRILAINYIISFAYGDQNQVWR